MSEEYSVEDRNLDGLINRLNYVLRELGRGYVTYVLNTYVRANGCLWEHPLFMCKTSADGTALEVGPLGMLGYLAGTTMKDGQSQNAVCAVLEGDSWSSDILYFTRTDGKPIRTPHQRRVTSAELLEMWRALYKADVAAYEELIELLPVHTFFYTLRTPFPVISFEASAGTRVGEEVNEWVVEFQKELDVAVRSQCA